MKYLCFNFYTAQRCINIARRIHPEKQWHITNEDARVLVADIPELIRTGQIDGFYCLSPPNEIFTGAFYLVGE